MLKVLRAYEIPEGWSTLWGWLGETTPEALVFLSGPDDLEHDELLLLQACTARGVTPLRVAVSEEVASKGFLFVYPRVVLEAVIGVGA